MTKKRLSLKENLDQQQSARLEKERNAIAEMVVALRQHYAALSDRTGIDKRLVRSSAEVDAAFYGEGKENLERLAAFRAMRGRYAPYKNRPTLTKQELLEIITEPSD